VFGVLPGMIGMIQATETIKLLTGIGEPLIGRLLLFDALKMKFREFKLRRDPQCPVCGDSPTIKAPIDYDAFCEGQAASGVAALPAISVRELKEKMEAGDSIMLLDVREPFEYEIARIDGSALIPLNELSGRLDELDPEKEIVALCKSGARSASAVQLLQSAGYARSVNLAGGIDAWADEIDPTMPKY
jgi:rhodanese-related sulfurtransferase